MTRDSGLERLTHCHACHREVDGGHKSQKSAEPRLAPASFRFRVCLHGLLSRELRHELEVRCQRSISNAHCSDSNKYRAWTYKFTRVFLLLRGDPTLGY